VIDESIGNSLRGNQHSGKYSLRLTCFVIPAKAGIQLSQPF